MRPILPSVGVVFCQNLTSLRMHVQTMCTTSLITRSTGVNVETAASSPITRLPFELIAGIMLYSTSPADILSLTGMQAFPCDTDTEPRCRVYLEARQGSNETLIPRRTLASPSYSWLISSMADETAEYVFCRLFTLPMLTFRSRCAVKVRTIYARRFLSGYVSMETLREFVL